MDLDYFVQDKKGEEEVGLRMICPIKRVEKKRRGEKVSRGVKISVRSAGRKIMIELVSQIDSKKAYCHIKQPMRNRPAPSMSAAGANRKKSAC